MEQSFLLVDDKVFQVSIGRGLNLTITTVVANRSGLNRDEINEIKLFGG
jgi:hypothetical protein